MHELQMNPSLHIRTLQHIWKKRSLGSRGTDLQSNVVGKSLLQSSMETEVGQIGQFL
jgi:hypothetical protein